MSIKFNIKKGMRPEEIVGELHGKVSGETQQEVAVFMDTARAKNAPLLSHEVVFENGEYALLLKRNQKPDLFGNISVTNEYYLCGINDEGKYFVHIAHGLMASLKLGAAGFQNVLDWINRKDQQFDKRVQGDILVKFVSARTHQMQGQSIGLGQTSRDNEWTEITFGNREIRVEKLTGAVMKLGNHTLFTQDVLGITAKPYFESDFQEQFVVVAGKMFTLQHGEHGVENIGIPQGRVAVLAPQRGREFKIDVQQGWPAATGFD